MTACRIARALAVAGALALSLPAAADARVRHIWVAATPVTWNIAPTARDAITGTELDPAETIFPTVVYRRYTRGWGRPLPNASRSSSDGLTIPGPLIRAKAGDRLEIHFKNLDTLRRAPHSMHFHGVDYRPSSDGAYLPGFSSRGGNVKYGEQWTYRLRARRDSVGVWPYHDHSQSMVESLEGGMFGMLSIRGRHEPVPDREFQVVFSPMGTFMAINGRAFVGNTPVFRARVGDLVQWDVMALGSDFHTFHVHGHRWRGPGGVPRDTQTVGPAESFRVRWREDAPGTWLYHCHVEDHMMRGMIGIYRVAPR